MTDQDAAAVRPPLRLVASAAPGASVDEVVGPMPALVEPEWTLADPLRAVRRSARAARAARARLIAAQATHAKALRWRYLPGGRSRLAAAEAELRAAAESKAFIDRRHEAVLAAYAHQREAQRRFR